TSVQKIARNSYARVRAPHPRSAAGSSGRPIIPVRRGPMPHRLERSQALLSQGLIVASLLIRPVPDAIEMVEHHDRVVEHPQIASGDQKVASMPAAQPANLFTGGDVWSAVTWYSKRMWSVTGSDTIRARRTLYPAPCRIAHQIEPVPPPLRGI